jgi:coproporphyrinogen III oxidase-like Fe-S oxidoreductase
MANLIITGYCNRNCSYCFASGVRNSDSFKKNEMSLSHFIQNMGLLKNSEVNELRLLGGEPSLHPEFLSFIRHGLDEGFNIHVFSNGLVRKDILSEIAMLPDDKIKFCINSIEPSNSSNDFIKQEKTLAVLGKKAGLGVNIYHAGQNLNYLIPLIEQHKLSPEIRLGIAHPIVPPDNQYLQPKFYRVIGNQLVQLINDASRKNIRLNFDCGFVPCMFPEEVKNTIKEHFKDIGRRCNPLPDILWDRHAISCFPLIDAIGIIDLNEYRNTKEIISVFLEKLKPFQSTGIFPHCAKCELFNTRECFGGCRAYVINRFKRIKVDHEDSTPVFSKVKSDIMLLQNITTNDIHHKERKAIKWTIPYIDQPPGFWEKINRTYGKEVQGVYFPLPYNIIASGRPIQPMNYFSSFLEETKCRKNIIINPIILPEKVEKIGHSIIQQINSIIKKTEIQEITLTNIALARIIRKEFPEISLTASTLMDIAMPAQLTMLEGLFDRIVPSGKILRNLGILSQLRKSFQGEIRLLVNEACMPGCLHRIQHFYEMGSPNIGHPESLCHDLLNKQPWLCLTGAWILPQFLDLYDGLYDDLKLEGRVTLRNPDNYLKVLTHYLRRMSLQPHEIGGGPASITEPMDIDKEFFRHTLYCDHNCLDCHYCRDYWTKKHYESSGKKSRQLPGKFEEVHDMLEDAIQQIKHQIPADIDLAKITKQWEKVPENYHYGMKTMPSPEWRDNGLRNSPEQCWEIILEKIAKPVTEPISVYVHVPFCDRKCNFCDCHSMVVSKRNPERITQFSQLLLSEIKLWTMSSNIHDRHVTTIHFGGGSPGYLPSEKLCTISDSLKKELNITDSTEWALESTSSMLSREQLQVLSETGFSRLHIGVQTLDDSIRRILGRKETTLEVMRKLDSAIQMGFIVSVDIIYGLPFQHVESLLDTLSILSNSGIHGFSIYHLNITNQNRKFFERIKGFERSLMQDYLLFQIADQFLIKKGYMKNHFVHYAKEADKNLYYNHVCRNEDLLALGPTADGIFDDYYYVHKWNEEYLANDRMIFPPVQGGGYLSAREAERRQIKAHLIGAVIPVTEVNSFNMEQLFKHWMEYDLIEKSGMEFRLTGSGSWHITKMTQELMQYGI